MLKKLLATFALVLFISAPVSAEAPTYNGFQTATVTVNGAPLGTSVPPVIMDGTTLVPLRAVAEAFQADVSFNPVTHEVNIQGTDVEALRRQVAQLQYQVTTSQSTQSAVDLLQKKIADLEHRLDELEHRNIVIPAIYEKARPSVVSLTVFTKSPQGVLGMATGTGVISWRSSDKTEVQITTNVHVVRDATDIYVVCNDGSLYKGSIWSTDGDLDYAVVKVTGQNLPEPISWGKPDSLQIGDPIVLVGNPLGYRNSVSVGVLSGRSYLVDNNGYEFLQTDAAASPGSSGGAVLDGHGNWIGMITLKAVSTGAEGLTFAISVNAIRKSIDVNIRSKGRAYLGAVLEQNYGATAGATTAAGVTIHTLDPNGPLAKAGFMVGDELLAMGTSKVKTLAHLRTIVDETLPGTTLRITAVRGANSLVRDIHVDEVGWAETKPVLKYARSLPEDAGAF